MPAPGRQSIDDLISLTSFITDEDDLVVDVNALSLRIVSALVPI